MPAKVVDVYVSGALLFNEPGLVEARNLRFFSR